ncbi:PKD domain-containing protein [Taibaiella soli]|nr:PKD domain-containing protein [Taibaiella soli]
MLSKLSFAALLLFFFLFDLSSIDAQSWLWGKRGGGIGEPQNAAEEVNRIATDKAGNIYVLADVYDPYINIGNHSLAGYGSTDIAISSWSCDGSFRWSKIIGTSSTDRGLGMAVDTLGGVYVTGYLVTMSDSVHISTDTSFYTANTYKNLFVVKYDTGGNYQWFRMPESDTVTMFGQNYTNAVDIDVDGSGNVTLLTRLAPGAYVGGSFIVNDRGFYLMRYSKTGTFQGATDLHLGYKGYPYLLNKMQMSCDHRNGRIYIAGTIDPLFINDTLIVGNTIIDKTMYIMCFDAQGNSLWVKQSATSNNVSGFRGHPAIDATGCIYLAGTSYAGQIFNGATFTNSFGLYSLPFVIKLDTNGNNIWLKSAETNGGTYGSDIALTSNGEVALLGAYPGRVSWAGYGKVLNHVMNTGYDIFLARFNAQTGVVTGMDSIASSFGANEFADGMAVDARSNIYVGGFFVADMYINTDTIQKIGGYADWFVAKYGFNNCNCTVPVASFGYSLAGKTAQFSYGGSSQVDSVRWTFGDSSTSTQQNPSHTYAAVGTYTACLTVYNNCGHTDTCRVIQIASSVNNVNPLANVLVYPNPVQNHLTIETPTSYHATILTIDGRVLLQQELMTPRTQINTGTLSPGIYLLQLTDNNGQRALMKFIKE